MGILDKFKKMITRVKVVEVESSRARTIKKLRAAAQASASWGLNSVSSMLQSNMSDRLSRQQLYSMSLRRMRLESRRTYWSSNIAKAAIKRIVENTINTGLKLQAIPQWNLLSNNKTDEQKKTWTQNTESRFRLWATSTNPDIQQQKNLYQLQTQAFSGMLKDGEFFGILRYTQNQRLQNPLTIQLVDPGLVLEVVNKEDLDKIKARGNTTKHGIEYDKNSRPVAYYFTDQATAKNVRVEKVGKRTGRIFVLHGFLPEWIGQGRGIPLLTGVIRDLQKLADYEVAEIAAAVINASIAAWIMPSDKKPSSKPFSGIQLKDATARNDVLEEIVETPFSEGLMDSPAIVVQNLKAGEKMESFDTKRPNADFDKFMTAVKKNLSASLSIPIEILDQLFGSNFSASRAALVMFWNAINIYRSDFSAMFNRPIYESWMSGEIRAERILVTNWAQPVAKQAWINSQWIGISKPSIDPAKEAKASTERISQGTTTRDREAGEYNGTSFDENVERLKNENKEMAIANENLGETSGSEDRDADDDEPENESED